MRTMRRPRTSATLAGGTSLERRSQIAYDAAGNVTSHTRANGLSDTRTYDALNRLRRVLGGVMPPLNLWVRTAPRGADRFCWRIDIVPRLTHLAGLELGTGVHLNVVAPERAAAELRDAG